MELLGSVPALLLVQIWEACVELPGPGMGQDLAEKHFADLARPKLDPP